MNFKNGVSFIVTVYNKEKFIEKTLESIFIQMDTHSQLIVVNDGSTDDSLKRIKKIVRNKKLNIRLITQKNSGPSIAINHALKFVKYSFIKLVDGDDLIAPDSVKYMTSEMNRLNVDLLYGYWEWTDRLEGFKFKQNYMPARIIQNALERFIIGGWGGSSNLMVRSQCLLDVGGCDENVFVQDFSIPLRIAGFHLKNKNFSKFSIAQSDKTVCVGPKFLKDRIMDNNGQTLYDLSMAKINFIEQHPLLEKRLLQKCKKKIIARCWSWERKKNNVSFFSKNFLHYLYSKINSHYPNELIRYLVFQTWKPQKKIKKINYSSNERKKILIYVGLDLLGDALLKLPMLQCLKLIFPKSHITWLAGKGSSVFKSSLKPLSHGLIDEVKDNASIGSKISELFLPINLGKYDIVIDTQKRLLTTLIIKKISTKIFVSPSCNFFFSDINLTKKKEENLSKQLLNLALLFSNKDNFDYIKKINFHKTKKVAICPGASVEWKIWNIKNFIEIAKMLIKKKRAPIFILGPKEKNLYKKLKKNFKNKKYFSLVNDPMDTIKIASSCSLGISNDTGCGHLLATAGIPIITIFGPTNQQKFSPIGNSKNKALSSQEIYNSKNINKIQVSDVLKEVEKIIKI